MAGLLGGIGTQIQNAKQKQEPGVVIWASTEDPPHIGSQVPSINKEITVYSSFMIGSAGQFANGVLIWWPETVGEMHLYALARGNGLNFGWPGTNAVFDTFSDVELLLPFPPLLDIRLTPSPSSLSSSDFTFGRVFAGNLVISSQTQAPTGAQISGTFAGGTLTGIPNEFSISTIVSGSLPKSDGVAGITVSTGMTVQQMGEVALQQQNALQPWCLSMDNQSVTRTRIVGDHGILFSYPTFTFSSDPATNVPGTNIFGISPFVGGNSAYYSGAFTRVQRISPIGAPVFRFGVIPFKSSVDWGSQAFAEVLIGIHTFSAVDVNAAIVNTQVVTRTPIASVAPITLPVPAGLNAIDSLMQIEVLPQRPEGTTWIMSSFYWLVGGCFTLQGMLFGTAGNDSGQLDGPVRVGKWESVGAAQEIVVTGILKAQLVPANTRTVQLTRDSATRKFLSDGVLSKIKRFFTDPGFLQVRGFTRGWTALDVDIGKIVDKVAQEEEEKREGDSAGQRPPLGSKRVREE